MIQLTTAFDMGDLDADYTHVKVVQFALQTEQKNIQFTTRLGKMVDSAFVPGEHITNATQKSYFVGGAEYDALVASLTSDADVSIYNEVARTLYQWLIDNNHCVGSIV